MNSVREYAVIYLGSKGRSGGGVAGGGNVVLVTGTHALDAIEHGEASDGVRLDATAAHHGLLPKLSGVASDMLRGDGSFSTPDLDDLGDVAAPAPSDGDALTWETASNAWVPVHAVTEDDVIALITPDIYACDSLTVISSRGTIAAGAHTDLHAVGGTTVQIDEATGAVGINIEAAFSGVDGLTNVYCHGYYTGNHTLTLDLYNYDTTSWDTVITFPTGGSAMTLLSGAVADGAPYFDGGGNAVARFHHAANGNASHRLHLDYLAIAHSTGTTGGLTLDALTDVTAPAPVDGDILSWDDGAAAWVNVGAPSGTVPSGTDPGDVLAWDGGAWDVLPVGADDEVLTADSGEALGLKWAAAIGGATIHAARLVQEAADSDGGTTTTPVLGATPSTANTLIAVCVSATGTISSVASTDTTWTQIAATAGGNPQVSVWKGVFDGSGTMGTTVTVTGSSGATAAAVGEWSGLNGTAGTTAEKTGTSTAYPGIGALPMFPAADCIVFAGVGYASGAGEVGPHFGRQYGGVRSAQNFNFFAWDFAGPGRPVVGGFINRVAGTWKSFACEVT